jgi:hypothetical protein
MRLIYKKLPEQFGEGLVARYKGVRATIYQQDDYHLIYTIESQNEGKGEVREFIQLLREDKGKIKSSIPLNEKWEMICKKYGIEVIKDK